MEKWRCGWIVVVVALLVSVPTIGRAEAEPPAAVRQTIAEMQKISDAFAWVAQQVQPGVVTVFSEKTVKVGSQMQQDPFQQFFGDDFFRRFFRAPQGGERHESGLGSGVIVSKDGYILTNNHVVDDADKVSVELADRRKFDAKVVGVDKKSDVAVLKIDATDLPMLTLGDSDRLKTGEWVLAVGNPFGLQHTVTYGIVSAVGRGDVGLADYEDFIQTDAAINPGNSGGALVNLHGEVVGVNTAIVTRSGGYQGIGFAIPITMANSIMAQLIAHGTVRRGFLGVTIQMITPEMADALGLKSQKGVVIGGISSGTPADKAGLKRGDVILKLNEEPVSTPTELRNRIAQSQPGDKVRLTVQRDGKARVVAVKLGELPGDASVAAGQQQATAEVLGLQVQGLTSDLAGQLGYQGEHGVVVTAVQPGSVGAEAGLRQGDLIEEVNRQAISNPSEFQKALSKVSKGQALLLLVRRQSQTFFVALRMGE